MSTTPPTPENPQEPEPRYGVRLPGGQVPGAQPTPGSPAQPPADDARPGWDASPTAPNDGIPVQPSGIYTGQPAQDPYAAQNPYGQAPYGQAAYGAPAAGGVYGMQYGMPAPGQIPPRPTTARLASILLWVGSALYAVLGVIPLFTTDVATMRDLVLGQFPENMRAQYAEILTVDMLKSSLAGAAVILLLICAFAALVGWLTWRGSNAWRIVGTVCGALAVVGNLSGGITLLFSALAAAIIILWWVRPSSEWFRANAAARRQR